VPPTDHNPSTRHSVLATARRTAALVNALADPQPQPRTIADLLCAHGETGPLHLTPADIRGMRTGAALLRDVFAAPDTDAAAHTLNRLLADHTGSLRLTSHHGSTAWHPHLDSRDDAPWAEWFLASSCMALTALVWNRQRPPGGLCAATGCHHVYLDEGSGRPKRYCSRRCATRERVAAHRRAQR
jgi:hypothetical protein